MDEPARKRRKTTSPEGGERPISPLKQPPRRLSISSRSYIIAEERQPSPLKEPPRRFSISPTKGASDRFSSPLKEPPRRPPRRPSFASPTKASLARGYPELLQRPPSSGSLASNAHADALARGKEARIFILGEQVGGMPTAPVVTGTKGDETAAGAQSPRTSKARPDATPQTQRTQSATNESIANNNLEEEVDLPATPSQRALEEQYTPRPGLFSSPSKRPPRLKHPMKKTSIQKGAPPVQESRPDEHLGERIQDAENKVEQVQQEKGLPPDYEIEEMKREKARLVKQLKALEKQVSRCTEEIAKMQTQPATYVSSTEEREGLVSLINDLCKSEEEIEHAKPQPVSSLLCSFLPFSAQGLTSPKPEHASPVASHQPLELVDPLPYLQMFTSFKFSAKLNLPRGQNPPSSNRVHQKHAIEIISPHNLLKASISISIDTESSAIVDLKLLRLSHWADHELGSFIRARAERQDLGNACWAIGSYWDIAKKRAEYWHRCEVAFGHLIPGKTSEDTENTNVPSRSKSNHKFSRKNLNRHFGRDTLVLEDRHVLLTISWKIGFDWTGEAESEIGIVPAIPRVWREADSNDSFKKIPETFTSLLQSKGAFAATKTMVALLFSE